MIIGSWMSAVVQIVWFVFCDEFSVTVLWLTVFWTMILNVPMKCLWWLASQGESAKAEQHRWSSSGCSFPPGQKIEHFQGINRYAYCFLLTQSSFVACLLQNIGNQSRLFFSFLPLFFSPLMCSLEGGCLAVQVKGPVCKKGWVEE